MMRLGAAAIVACLLTASCSSGNSSTGSASSTSTSTSTSSTSTTTEAPPAADSPADVWVELWTAATAEGSTAEDLEPFATRDVAEQILTIVTIDDHQRREVLNSPNFDPAETVGGGASVEDCAFLTPPQAEAAANFFRGSGTVDADGVFRFDGFEVVSRTGCIPAELNEAVLADYEDYWHGLNEISNPPNPDSPRLPEIASGDHLENLRRLTTDDAANQRYYRENPTIHPEVTEWRTATTVVVLDCQETDPAYGAYDQQTDERLATDPPPKPGQRDLREITLAFESGRWKVIDRQGSTDTACEFAPTPLGVAVV